MILPFSTKINNKPTFFVEKILKALLDLSENTNNLILRSQVGSYIYKSGEHLKYEYADDILNKVDKSRPKLHSFREDKNNRWKVGKNIDFFINARQKNMFRFAPRLPVVSIQNIEIEYSFCFDKQKVRPILFIDDMIHYNPRYNHDRGMLTIAQNDGFDTIEDFFAYFNKDFHGKIIHWTDLKY